MPRRTRVRSDLTSGSVIGMGSGSGRPGSAGNCCGSGSKQQAAGSMHKAHCTGKFRYCLGALRKLPALRP